MEIPPPGQFSKMIGEDPSFLRGRSFLLEVNPSSPYEKSVNGFTSELSKGGCEVHVFTHKTSPVYKLLSIDPSLNFVLSSSTVTRTTQEGGKKETIIPQGDMAVYLDLISKKVESARSECVVFVVDSLSDILISTSFQATYKFLKNANEVLAGTNVSSLFLMSRGIHDEKIVATFRSMFSNHLVSVSDGVTKLVRKN